MTTLEDKILGVKKDYYCSSSESEEDSDDSDGGKNNDNQKTNLRSAEPEPSKWGGSSKNTGPKGVIRDWEMFKQLENEKLIDQEMQKIALAKKLTLSSSQNQEDEMDKEFLDLMSDEFLLQYQKQRMEEMLIKPPDLPKFGEVLTLKNGNDFLEAIDNENKLVTIIIHIFEESNAGCKTMNKCLETLCKQYPLVKFCKINGSCAGMSHRFKVDGVPALLVYKEGAVIGNFIRVTDELGDEFYDSDVENFLIEHGIINDRYCVPVLMQTEEDEDGGSSDWSLE